MGGCFWSMQMVSTQRVDGLKKKQAEKLNREACTLMDSLSLCRYAPLKHTACSVV